MKTVIGLFDTVDDAHSAQNELLAAGIGRERVSLITSERSGGVDRTDRTDGNAEKTEAAEGAGIGATTGALAGGAAGLLASLGLLAIPGIGGLLAAGPLVAILTGAGVGAATGGLLGGLIGLGIPAHEAELYQEGVRRGGVLLTVDATDNDADRIAAILTQHHAIDIDKRASEWEASGWARKHSAASAPPIDARTRGLDREDRMAGGMDPGTSDIGTSRRISSVRIYNP